tara:strand:- start:47 stop:238 length:192 start_codon:yes stop_codon:yes gene_type:complete
MTSNRIDKARLIRSQNIAKSKTELSKIVLAVDKIKASKNITTTEACRSKNISTERYYRFKRNA